MNHPDWSVTDVQLEHIGIYHAQGETLSNADATEHESTFIFANKAAMNSISGEQCRLVVLGEMHMESASDAGFVGNLVCLFQVVDSLANTTRSYTSFIFSVHSIDAMVTLVSSPT